MVSGEAGELSNGDMIGAEEKNACKAVEEYAENLRKKIFPDLQIGHIHGRMKAKEKDKIMSAFAAGDINILVATTVIEVGVDVPNAVIIVIENAERFGLSQLHQLRGRVGRGQEQSYCILISDAQNEDTKKRLKAMTRTADGFQIAEEDLKIRGPGDFFGRRQHGLPNLKVADLGMDTDLLKQAQEAAEKLSRDDPGLKQHELIIKRVAADKSACCFKIQIAYYEAMGIEGLKAYIEKRLGVLFPKVSQHSRVLYNSKRSPLFMFCFRLLPLPT